MTTINQTDFSRNQLNIISDKLSSASVFMQFGAGSITLEAVRLESIQSVIAVESNKSVSDKLYELANNKEKLRMMYANLGEVNESGVPEGNSEFLNYHQYMVLPWALADKYNTFPDLILIDGPFKVASFLYSLVCAEEGTTILFNNFFNNEAYSIARNYALLEERHDGLAEFTVHKNYVISELTAMIAKYSVIPD